MTTEQKLNRQLERIKTSRKEPASGRGKGIPGFFEKMSRDLIIDCFARGGGASVGIEMALGRPVDIAINHDPDAIPDAQDDHPDTLHLTEDIFKVDLKKYVKGRHVSLMWASPDCTSHSKAKGREATGKRPENPSVGCVQACEGYPAGRDPDGECGRDPTVGTAGCGRASD